MSASSARGNVGSSTPITQGSKRARSGNEDVGQNGGGLANPSGAGESLTPASLVGSSPGGAAASVSKNAASAVRDELEVHRIELTAKEISDLSREPNLQIRSKKKELYVQRALGRWHGLREKNSAKLAKGLSKQITNLRVQIRLRENETRLQNAKMG